MSSREWEEYVLEDVVDKFIDYRGKTPQKTTSGIPLITAKIIKNGFIQKANEFISEDNYFSWMTRGLPAVDDVVMTTEAPLGEVAQIKTSDKIALAQRIITMRGKYEILNNTFLRYFLQSGLGQSRLYAKATGTTVIGIKSAELKKISIFMPQYFEQKAIAATLTSLDDMIELNNRTNQILEEIVQAIFKHWFVGFEFPNEDGQPYKSSGGEMVDSELGEIPKGWRVCKLGEICEIITKGTTPTTLKKSFVTKGINFIKAESITDNHCFDHSKFAFIDMETNTLLRRSIIKENDILFTIAGTIGRFAIATNKILPANTNQAVAIIRIDESKCHILFVLCCFLCGLHFDFYTKRVQQAVQANLSLTTIKDLPLPLPPHELLDNFVAKVSTLFAEMNNNNEQSSILTFIRNTILPKLMSGEIRVPIEEVV